MAFNAGLILIALGFALGDFVLFPYQVPDISAGVPFDSIEGFGNTTTLTAACATALNQTILCDPRVQLLAASEYYGTPEAAFCTASCNTSLLNYHASVATACSGINAFDSFPNSWRGDSILGFFKLVCTKDPSNGQFCPDWLSTRKANFSSASTDLDLPNSILCSSCQLDLFKTIQSSQFLGYDTANIETITAVNSRCHVNISSSVLSPPEGYYPISSLPSSTANQTCFSDTFYTWKSQDTCRSVASAKSVAEGTLWSINNLFPDCSNIRPGKSTCLPKSCTTYSVTPTDDCWSIAFERNISFASFLNYNPTIIADCSNMPPNGTVVCIGSPDGTFIPTYPTWASVPDEGLYRDIVVVAPGASAFGSTLKCGQWYRAQIADTCSRISISSQVPLDLFLAMNPSIDGGCTNLIPDIYYCIHPIFNWNSTNTTTTTTTRSASTISPPAPTQSGTTGSCFSWHVVVSGNSCSLLQSTLGVTMAQLLAWNLNLRADCTNLELGGAYCISGPPLSSTTSRSSTTTFVSSVSTTSSTRASSTSAGSSCGRTYTVVSGDWCAKIWELYNLTELQFRALNPGLNTNCDIQIGQVVCVLSAGSATTSSVVATSTSRACTRTYTVISGDWCAKIWEANGLTETVFRSLNPTLNAKCDIVIGQVVCVA